MTKRQENQAKAPQTAKGPLPSAWAGLKSAIHLTPDAKLRDAEKRRLTAAVKKAKQDGKIPRTAQQTIPYPRSYSNADVGFRRDSGGSPLRGFAPEGSRKF